MYRIEREEMSRSFDTAGDFVDVDELEIGLAPSGTKGETPHPAEAVDANSRRH